MKPHVWKAAEEDTYETQKWSHGKTVRPIATLQCTECGAMAPGNPKTLEVNGGWSRFTKGDHADCDFSKVFMLLDEDYGV